MVNAIAATFGGVPGDPGEAGDIYDAIEAAMGLGGSQGSTEPAAYLNYILFDKDLNYLQGGFVNTVDGNQGSVQQFSINDIEVTQPGHLFVYVSSESSNTNKQIWFDELEISTTQPIIQVDEYYPFGLSISELSTTRENIIDQNFKYNGKELQDDFDLGWYDYGARMYDATIGRRNHVDPHSENYMSISSYTAMANNPLLFIDPTGKDIAFYIWSRNGDEWERKKVSFDQLDKKVQKALESFAKTDVGNAFLSQFANEGDKIGSVEFKKDGEFSKHEIGFDQFKTTNAAYGTSGFSNDKTSVQFYMKINTSRSDEYDNPESYAITVGHEAFLHIDQYKERIIKAIENQDVKAYYKIRKERRKIANERNGGKEHDGYLEGKPEYSRMKVYINQLKNILNPSEVNKQIQRHDNTLKKRKR